MCEGVCGVAVCLSSYVLVLVPVPKLTLVLRQLFKKTFNTLF